MNALELKGATKRYDGFTLDGIDMALPEGCILGLIGENGAGKTTTISLLLGLCAADEGAVSMLGVDSRDRKFDQVKQHVGAVLDESGYPEVLSPRQIGKIMRHCYRNWLDEAYAGYLARFSLPENRPYKDLSRGMKVKLGLAVALSHKAKLLILDESTSGLDPVARDEILTLLQEFTRDESHSVLISSHIVQDLEKVCDYIAFVHGGKLIFVEEKDALLDKYALLKCGREQFKDVDAAAVVGSRASAYGVEALVLRERVSGMLPLEHSGIEDIMLFMGKAGA